MSGPASGRRSVLVLVAGNFALPLASLVSAPILARSLGPAGRGQLAAVTAILSICVVVALAGTPAAVTYFVAVGRRRGLVRRTAQVTIPCMVVTAGGLFCYAVAQPRGLLAAYLVALASIPLAVIVELRRSWVLGEDNYSPITLERALLVVIRTAALAVAAAVGALTVFSAMAITSASVGLAAVALIGRRSGRRTQAVAAEAPASRELTSYGARSFLTTVSAFTSGRLDQLLLGLFVPPSELGFYVVAVAYLELTTFGTQAVSTLVRTRAASQYGPAQVSRIAALIFYLNALGVTGLVLLAPVLLGLLFGPSFAPATQIVYLLAIAYVAAGSTRIIGSALAAAGRPGLETVAEGVGLFLTVAGLAVLLPAYGVAGAAITTCVSYVVVNALLIGMHSRVSGLSWTRYLAISDVRAFLLRK